MATAINKHAAALGRAGGLATRRKLSAERRRELASHAGRAAWAGKTKQQRSDIMKTRQAIAKRSREKSGNRERQ
jgi:hypothetical protein